MSGKVSGMASSQQIGMTKNGMLISRSQPEIDCMEAFEQIRMLPAKLTVPSLYKAASNLNTSSYSRIWLARCLVSMGDWRGFDLARQTLINPTPELLSSAIDLAFECQGRMEMVYDVENGRRHLDLGIRTKDELSKAIPKMVALLSSKEKMIRWYAASGFEKSHATRAIVPLIQTGLKDQDASNRLQVISALASLTDNLDMHPRANVDKSGRFVSCVGEERYQKYWQTWLRKHRL